MQYEKMKEAVDRFFSDKSRSPQQTLDGLETIREEIDVMIESLKTFVDGDDMESL